MKRISIQTPFLALVRSELVTSLRRWRSFAILAFFVCIGIFIIWTGWPHSNESLFMMGNYSRMLFEGCCVCLMFGSAIFVPALAAGSIVVEKERQTFDMLTLTLIRPSGLMWGKLLSSVGFYILLVIACFPIMGATFFLVGLDWFEVMRAMMALLLTTITLATIAVMCSALCRKTLAAIICSMLGSLALMVGGPIWIVALFDWNTFEDVYDWFLETFCPLGLLLEPHRSYWGLVPGVLYQVAVICVCWRITVLVLRRPQKPPRISREVPVDDPTVIRRRRKTFPFYLLDPLRRKKPIGDSTNPMLAKEMRWGAVNRGTLFIREFYVAFVVFLVIGLFLIIGNDGSIEGVALWLVAEIGLVALAAPALMANVLTKEYELGNIDILRMTLLRPGQILLGKLCAGAMMLSPIVLATLLVWAVLYPFTEGTWEMLFTACGTLLTCCLVSLSLGLFSSLLCKRTTAALVVTYTLSMLAFGGVSFIMMLVCEEVLNLRYSEYMNFVCFLSPLAAFIQNLEESKVLFRNRAPETLLTFYWLSNVATFSVFSVILTCVSLEAFAEFRMKDR